MKKQTLWFLLSGNLLVSFHVFSAHFFTISETITDFMTGLGIGLMISAVFMMRKKKQVNG